MLTVQYGFASSASLMRVSAALFTASATLASSSPNSLTAFFSAFSKTFVTSFMYSRKVTVRPSHGSSSLRFMAQ